MIVNGVLVTPSMALGYVNGDLSCIVSTRGATIGSAEVITSWPAPHGGGRVYQIEATIDGRRYTGRSAGADTVWRGKAMKEG